MNVGAIVVAGGHGERFGGLKQFAELNHETLARRSVTLARTVADTVVLVVPAAYQGDGEGADLVVTGGATRSDSTRKGLAALTTCDVVLVHDAVRPMATPELFRRVLEEVVKGADAVIPGVPVTDTIKRVRDGVVLETLPRDELVAVQTPQAFRAELLRGAHGTQGVATDDAALVEARGGRVVVVEGEIGNVKVTTARDLELMRLAAV